MGAASTDKWVWIIAVAYTDGSTSSTKLGPESIDQEHRHSRAPPGLPRELCGRCPVLRPAPPHTSRPALRRCKDMHKQLVNPSWNVGIKELLRSNPIRQHVFC